MDRTWNGHCRMLSRSASAFLRTRSSDETSRQAARKKASEAWRACEPYRLWDRWNVKHLASSVERRARGEDGEESAHSQSQHQRWNEGPLFPHGVSRPGYILNPNLTPAFASFLWGSQRCRPKNRLQTAVVGLSLIVFLGRLASVRSYAPA